MPEYSYICEKCQNKFSVICSIKDYKENIKCNKCQSSDTYRLYKEDLSTLNTSVRLSNSEIKTLGHLANRNTEKLSNDQKNYLYNKHNKYKDIDSQKELPKGISRIKKPKSRPKWT